MLARFWYSSLSLYVLYCYANVYDVWEGSYVHQCKPMFPSVSQKMLSSDTSPERLLRADRGTWFFGFKDVFALTWAFCVFGSKG